MSSSEVENVRKGAFGNDFYIGDFKLSMWIPAELGGKVIGVKGIIISNLKTETKCKLIKAMKPVGQSLWTAVVIIGDAFKCQSAYNAVAGIVSGEVDDVVLEIPKKKCSFLMGAGITVVKRVSAESDVRIHVSDRYNADRERDTGGTTLEGSCENVYKALELLFEAHKDHESHMISQVQNVNQNQHQNQNQNNSQNLTQGPGQGANSNYLQNQKHQNGSQRNAQNTEMNPDRSFPEGREKDEKWSKKPIAPSSSHTTNAAATATRAYSFGVSDARNIPLTEEEIKTRAASNSANVPKPNVQLPDKVKKEFSIPANLVGLFRNSIKSKPTVLYQVQKYTGTVVNKVNLKAVPKGTASGAETEESSKKTTPVPSPITVPGSDVPAPLSEEEQVPKVSTRRRRRSVSSDGSADNDNDGDENENGEGDDDDDGSEGFADALQEEETGQGDDSEKEKKENSSPKKENQVEVGAVEEKEKKEEEKAAVGGEVEKEIEEDEGKEKEEVEVEEKEKTGKSEIKARGTPIRTPILFTITGYYMENLDAAINCIENIVDGVRVGDALQQLRVACATLTLHSTRPHNTEWEKGGRGPGGAGGRGGGPGPTRPRGPGGRGGHWMEGTAESTRQPFHLAPRMATGAVGAMPKKTARKKVVPEVLPAE